MTKPAQFSAFAVFEWDLDGHRLVGNINLALRDSGAKAETPWFLSLSTPLLHQNTEGMPTREEAEELNQWEDAVEKQISDLTKYVFVGRVTWNGYRELLYYIDNPASLAPKLQSLINARKVRAFGFRAEHDANWTKVSIYLEGRRRDPAKGLTV